MISWTSYRTEGRGRARSRLWRGSLSRLDSTAELYCPLVRPDYVRSFSTEIKWKRSCYTIHPSQDRNLVRSCLNLNLAVGAVQFVSHRIQIFIHAPEDVPNFNHPQDEKESLFWGLNFHMRFSVSNINLRRESSTATLSCA